MIRRITTIASLLLASTGLGHAEAQRAHIGLHGGYHFDMDQALIDAQMHIPVGRSVEVYPSFDYYLVEGGSVLGFNGDLKFRAPGGPLYFGGGLNVLKASGGSSDAGLGLFGGFETRYGVTHPYVEVRALFHNNTSVQVVLGINMTLY